MTGENYQQFIRETFVDPIRSILIVDDDYPTYDEILSSQINSDQVSTEFSKKNWQKNPEIIREVIRKFRLNDPPLLVDIHDGINVNAAGEKKVVNHLHQSDLLILDYQLEKSKSNDGTLAIEILRDLMSNDHFNLVIVYTIESLDLVFDEVRWGLLSPSPVGRLTDEEKEMAKNEIEDATERWSDFYVQAVKSIENEQYFYSRIHESTFARTMAKGQQPYTKFHDKCKRAGLDSPESQKLVLRYLLQEFETENDSKMNKNNNDLCWSSNSTKWIRGESVFICFSNKTSDDDLLEELQIALNDWNPDPSRLLLAKLRAEMDDYGVVAENQVLSNKYALAFWYHRLLHAVKKPDFHWLVVESVSRHSDQLMEEVLTRVEEFAERLINAEVSSGNLEKKCLDHYKVDFSKQQNKSKAAIEHNAYVCSKSPSGWHLTTGHIFAMCNEHWLCLSPACDLVPSQLSEWQEETFGDHLPFAAIKLHDQKKLANDVQSNRHLFLKLDNKVRVFSFNSNANSAPNWDVLYATNKGEFDNGGFEFTVLRNKMAKRNDSEINFVLTSCSAIVVSQLRHQYALNLVQKFGASLTRVGLDFTNKL